MNHTRTWVKKLTLVLVLVSMLTGCLFTTGALAAAGDTPKHSKTLADNGDGTYTLTLSVTGDSETHMETEANVNVLIVYDESSSMTSNNVSGNRNRADYAEDVLHKFIDGLSRYQTGDGSNIEVALVGFGPNATTRQGWTSDLSDTTGINAWFDEDVDGTIHNSGSHNHNYNSNNGTNWQAALNQASTVLSLVDPDKEEKDPTFVILVTDDDKPEC